MAIINKEISLEDDKWEILTDDGFKPLKSLFETIPYQMYRIKLCNGMTLECADEHILIKPNGEEVFARDLKLGDTLSTVDGNYYVSGITNLKRKEVCYDLEVNSDKHLYYANGILSHNSATSACYLLWKALTNPDYTIAILANKESSAREVIDRIKLGYSMLPYYLKPAILEWNKKSITLDNGSAGTKIFVGACSLDSIRGKSCNIIYLDEYAHVNNAEEFYESTFPTISSFEDSQVLITSTPNGLNHFYSLYSNAGKGDNPFVAYYAHWKRNPERDEKWEKDTKGSMTEQSFAQEYECEFIGSALTLISGETLKRLHPDEPLLREGEDTKIYEKPDKEKSYIVTVDVGEGTTQDYSVVSVFDVTSDVYKQVAIYRNNKILPENLSEIIYSIGKTYNNAFVVIENNSVGRIVCNSLYYDMEYENVLSSSNKVNDLDMREGGNRFNLGLRQTAKTKSIGCATLKSLIQSDTLIIPDRDTIFELTNFVKSGQSYAGDNGTHDDCVMSLVIFAWLTSTDYFKENYSLNRNKIKRNLMEEESVPFSIFYSNGLDKNPNDLYTTDTMNVNGMQIPVFNHSNGIFF